jgi:hypothetical protein
LHADGYCDDVNNNEACFFDGGDCCGSNVNTDWCIVCQCLEGGGGGSGGITTPSGTTIDGDCNQFIGDGYCDDINNNLACTFDGGDCCLIVRISLTNELLNAGLEFLNGDYELSIMLNGQTSWINGEYAIWYYSGYWVVGNLVDIGSNAIYMHTSNDFYGLTDEENEWNYLDGSSWIPPTDQSDIQITCVNE